jgi:hypothetical protein
MAGMKITLGAAMRARDVSRPRPEHLAEAAARDEPAPRAGAAAGEPRATPAGEAAAQPRARRRRRRGR